MLDLTLAGVSLAGRTPIEAELLKDRLSERDYIQFFQVLTVVSAIQEMAKIVVSNEGGFSRTSQNVKTLRGLMFPEIAEEEQDKADRTKKLIETEMSRGPIKIQRLDYGGKVPKKKRNSR